jgi:hypothetical protein
MKNLIFKGRKLFYLFSSALVMAGTMQAQIFTGAGFTIVDNGARVPASCSTVAVSGVTGNRNVKSISLNGMTHTWLGDTETRVYPPGAAAPPSTTGSFVISSPPDGRACNFNGNYRFIDTAISSMDAATVGCADAADVPPGDYLGSTYGGGVNPGPVISLATTFGSLTAAQVNGNWLVCVFDFATPDGGSVTSTSIQLVVPTAANVSISGRVVNASGQGISRATLVLSGSSGVPVTVTTNPFGYYTFDDLQVGETYILTVTSKTNSFANPTRVINVEDNISDADFVSEQ